ncbi:MAG TPA: hypothetical protein VFH68_25650 [Polyangia bacterium]|jgi:hypothetical protein|nr:hypothetical protein [Polyangia bacterium]
MTIERTHTWDRWAGGAGDLPLMVCAPLLLAGWLALSSWGVLRLGGLAGLSAPPATVAAYATDPAASQVVVSIGPVQFPCGTQPMMRR